MLIHGTASFDNVSSLAQELRGEQTSAKSKSTSGANLQNALPWFQLLQGHQSEPCHGRRIDLPSGASEPRSSALWYHHGRTSRCPGTRHCRRVQIQTCQGVEWKASPSYHWNWSSCAGSEWYLWARCHAGTVSRHEVCGTLDHHWTLSYAAGSVAVFLGDTTETEHRGKFATACDCGAWWWAMLHLPRRKRWGSQTALWSSISQSMRAEMVDLWAPPVSLVQLCCVTLSHTWPRGWVWLVMVRGTVACKECSVLLPRFPSICDRDALSLRFSLCGLQFQECACVFLFAEIVMILHSHVLFFRFSLFGRATRVCGAHEHQPISFVRQPRHAAIRCCKWDSAVDPADPPPKIRRNMLDDQLKSWVACAFSIMLHHFITLLSKLNILNSWCIQYRKWWKCRLQYCLAWCKWRSRRRTSTLHRRQGQATFAGYEAWNVPTLISSFAMSCSLLIFFFKPELEAKPFQMGWTWAMAMMDLFDLVCSFNFADGVVSPSLTGPPTAAAPASGTSWGSQRAASHLPAVGRS